MFNTDHLDMSSFDFKNVVLELRLFYDRILHSVYKDATDNLDIIFNPVIVIPISGKIIIYYFETSISQKIEISALVHDWNEKISCVKEKFQKMYNNYYIELIEIPNFHYDMEYWTFILLRWNEKYCEKEKIIPIFLKYIIKSFISSIPGINTQNINIFDEQRVIQNGLYDMLDDIGGTYYKMCSSIVDDLSTKMYEGNVSTGSIIVTTEHIQCDISILEPINIGDDSLRELRKLLEISTKNLSMVFCGCKECMSHKMKYPKVIGFVSKSKINSEKLKTKFIINGYLDWEIEYDSEIICQSIERKLMIPYPKFNKLDLKIAFIDDLFCSIQDAQKLYRIVDLASQQSHGTSLIISNKVIIESEATRLCDVHRGYKIRPIDLSLQKNEEYIRQITSIDGAVLIDTNGYCYAIGVILDGEAVVQGDVSRGARFNSVKNYIAWKRVKIHQEKYSEVVFAGIIISEDKTIDIITTNTIDFFDI